MCIEKIKGVLDFLANSLGGRKQSPQGHEAKKEDRTPFWRRDLEAVMAARGLTTAFAGAHDVTDLDRKTAIDNASEELRNDGARIVEESTKVLKAQIEEAKKNNNKELVGRLEEALRKRLEELQEEWTSHLRHALERPGEDLDERYEEVAREVEQAIRRDIENVRQKAAGIEPPSDLHLPRHPGLWNRFATIEVAIGVIKKVGEMKRALVSSNEARTTLDSHE